MHLSLQRSAVPNTSGTLQQSSNSHRLLNARTQRVFCPLCSKVVRKPLATHCQLLQHHCVMDPDSVWNGLSDVERTSLLVALLRYLTWTCSALHHVCRPLYLGSKQHRPFLQTADAPWLCRCPSLHRVVHVYYDFTCSYCLFRWNGSKYCWQSGPNKGQPLYSDPYGELWVNNCIPQKQQQTLMQQSNYVSAGNVFGLLQRAIQIMMSKHSWGLAGHNSS